MKLLNPTLLCMALLVSSVIAAAQEIPRPAEHGWIDFRKPILADPVLQHAKETYILYGCAYCHGVDLRVRNGEAADLLHSRLVAADTDGTIIVNVLKQGIPQTAKLSPMPQFSDLSNKELFDIARWIHYSRMEGHFAELRNEKVGEQKGDAAAGARYYQQNCQSCHDASSIAAKLKADKPANLMAYVIKPAFLEAVPSFAVNDPDAAQRAAGKARHMHLLENYEASDVANLLEYMRTLQ